MRKTPDTRYRSVSTVRIENYWLADIPCIPVPDSTGLISAVCADEPDQPYARQPGVPKLLDLLLKYLTSPGKLRVRIFHIGGTPNGEVVGHKRFSIDGVHGRRTNRVLDAVCVRLAGTRCMPGYCRIEGRFKATVVPVRAVEDCAIAAQQHVGGRANSDRASSTSYVEPFDSLATTLSLSAATLCAANRQMVRKIRIRMCRPEQNEGPVEVDRRFIANISREFRATIRVQSGVELSGEILMRLRIGFVALFCIVLAACGSGSSGARNTPPPPTAPPPAPPTGNSLLGTRPTVGPQEFVAFESGQVRPLALSADGQRLFAVNTPDNRLEIFSTSGGLQPLASVLVGLEPVAVALDPDGRAWVVNHLSDSVSIVDVDAIVPHVVQTVWVGDEPRDIVFAGTNRERAFISTAHRGQNSPVDPALNTPGIGRADLWVFDSTAADDTPGGTAEQIITLFGDRPRPLAVSGDGLRVFAGIFLSGNRTTSIFPNNFLKGAPTNSADNVDAPDSGLIARFDGRS